VRGQIARSSKIAKKGRYGATQLAPGPEILTLVRPLLPDDLTGHAGEPWMVREEITVRNPAVDMFLLPTHKKLPGPLSIPE